MERSGLPSLGEPPYPFIVRGTRYLINYGAAKVWTITPGRFILRDTGGEYELTLTGGKKARGSIWDELLVLNLP